MPWIAGFADDLEKRERVLDFAIDDRLDRIELDAAALREHSQAADDLGAQRSEGILHRGDVRGFHVEVDRPADGKLMPPHQHAGRV